MTSPASPHYAHWARRVLAGRGSMGNDLLEALRPLLGGRQVDLDEVLRAIVDETARLLDADRATFYLLDHARRELVSRAAHLPEIQEIRLRVGEGVAGWVAQRAQALRMGRDDEDPRFARRIDEATGYVTHNMIAVPVRDRAQTVVGVLQLLNKRSGDFTEADLRRLLEVTRAIASMLDTTSLRSQLQPDHAQPLSFRFNFIVGDSSLMQEVYGRVERAAGTDATVLIRGETGTGKELIARAVHFNSARRTGKLVKVDCAALPESLIENELFGHERGAYTGADRTADGKVHAADGGTLFLDEIGELSLPVQGKLLRLLQERTFLKVGATQPETANVRFVCATHRNLEELVQEGKFRTDLYYRLRVVEIELPPLRMRGHSDLDRLLDHFLYEFARTHNRPHLILTPEARATMHAYPWPGNVRELEHCVESAVVLSPTRQITPDLLPIRSGPMPSWSDPHGPMFAAPVGTLREIEAAYVRFVLDLCDGNQSAAAKRLGIGRNTLARKLKEG